jgi:hypothetical protein
MSRFLANLSPMAMPLALALGSAPTWVTYVVRKR